jgi:hypothetical protein
MCTGKLPAFLQVKQAFDEPFQPSGIVSICSTVCKQRCTVLPDVGLVGQGGQSSEQLKSFVAFCRIQSRQMGGLGIAFFLLGTHQQAMTA